MASTRQALQDLDSNLDESIGLRSVDGAASNASAQLSPIPRDKDIGRRPLRKFGQVEVARVMPDPSQPRDEFDAEDIGRLADSIKTKGQLHPIRVRWDSSRGKWLIISGERRYRATLAAGLPTIDCYFHESEITPGEILEQQLVENLLRADLQPIEQARAFDKLMKLNNWNGKQLAKALSITQSKVSRALALLSLPPDIQLQVASGKLKPTVAYELSKVDDEVVRRDVAQQAIAGNASHRDAVRTVRGRRGKKNSSSVGLKQTFLTETGWRIVASSRRPSNYHELEQALEQTLEEVQLRIRNNIRLT